MTSRSDFKARLGAALRQRKPHLRWYGPPLRMRNGQYHTGAKVGLLTVFAAGPTPQMAAQALARQLQDLMR